MVAPAPEFLSLLSSLRKGEQVHPRNLDALSDLHQAERDQLTLEWSAIPAETRLELMDLAADRSAADVTADFTALGSVALQDDDPRIRRFAVEAIGDSTDWRACDRLVAALGGDEDALVRAAAAAGLGEWAILAEGDQLAPDQAEQIIAILRKAATDVEEASEVRACALLSLSVINEDWLTSLITDFYYDEDRFMRLAAVQAMGISASEDWLDFLDEQLQSDDPEFRREAVTSVGELMIPSTIEAVAALLQDEDDEVVVAAIGALGEIGGDDAVEYLANFLEDADPELIEAIEEAIAFAGDPIINLQNVVVEDEDL